MSGQHATQRNHPHSRGHCLEKKQSRELTVFSPTGPLVKHRDRTPDFEGFASISNEPLPLTALKQGKAELAGYFGVKGRFNRWDMPGRAWRSNLELSTGDPFCMLQLNGKTRSITGTVGDAARSKSADRREDRGND